MSTGESGESLSARPGEGTEGIDATIAGDAAEEPLLEQLLAALAVCKNIVRNFKGNARNFTPPWSQT